MNVTDSPQPGINLPALDEELTQFCARYPIRKLSLFGSVLWDDFDQDSDLDVLVEFEPGARVGLMLMAWIARELGELVGRGIDSMTPDFLIPYFRQRVVDEAVVWFEKAV